MLELSNLKEKNTTIIMREKKTSKKKSLKLSKISHNIREQAQNSKMKYSSSIVGPCRYTIEDRIIHCKRFRITSTI